MIIDLYEFIISWNLNRNPDTSIYIDLKVGKYHNATGGFKINDTTK